MSNSLNCSSYFCLIPKRFLKEKKERTVQFLDIKTDYAFKKVFGSEESKNILLSFLNSLIEFEDGSIIEDLTIVDPYQIPLIQGMKDTYVDVKAVLSNKRRVIIEMQVLNVEGFEKRVLYNAAKLYSSQLKKGNSFTTLEPIIALTITDFMMFSDIKEVITYFVLKEKERLIKYSDDIELIFVELPKFTKDENQLENITDKWIYFVKNAGNLEYIPKTLQEDREIRKAFDIANTAGMSEEELEAQWKRHDFIFLLKGSIEYAYKKGKEEGRKELRDEGKLEGLIEGISFALEVKFGDEGIKLAERLKEIKEIDRLEEIKEDIKKLSRIDELQL
jgi:predicted transposase/invertase (TIGR01784 family)